MSKMISVKCTNTVHCGHLNVFPASDLVSGLALVNESGEVVNAHPQVKVDANTFVECEECRYPISCANATISD